MYDYHYEQPSAFKVAGKTTHYVFAILGILKILFQYLRSIVIKMIAFHL